MASDTRPIEDHPLFGVAFGPAERPEWVTCPVCENKIDLPDDADEWDCPNCEVTLCVE